MVRLLVFVVVACHAFSTNSAAQPSLGASGYSSGVYLNQGLINLFPAASDNPGLDWDQINLGDAPEQPGCLTIHPSYDSCTGFLYELGDFCTGAKTLYNDKIVYSHLYELDTVNMCQTKAASGNAFGAKLYDCARHCKQTYGQNWNGYCSMQENVCVAHDYTKTVDSGACFCVQQPLSFPAAP